MKLSDVTNRAVRDGIGTKATAKPILAINAAGAATVKTTGAIPFCIDNIAYSKAALAAQALALPNASAQSVQQAITGLQAYYVQPANTTVYYVLAVDAAGNVATFQGTYAGQALAMPNTNMPISGVGGVPDIDTSVWCPFGMIKIALGATTFTVATTLLDAANVTATYYDLMGLPTGNP